MIRVLLVAVPIAFTPLLRTFAVPKEVLFLGLVGAAWLTAAFAGTAPRLGRAWLALLAIGLALPFNLVPDGLLAASHLVAIVLLAVLLRTHDDDDVRQLLSLVLLASLALSGAQALGFGVLEATSTSFGGVHGRIVGFLGNPTMHVGWLILAAVLTRAPWPVWLAIVGVAVVDRARMGLAVIGVLAATRLGWKGVGLLVMAGVAAIAWDGVDALHGRFHLAKVSVLMVLRGLGVPAGPGTYGGDFALHQAALLPSPHMSFVDHAHFDIAELLFDYGLLSGLLVAGLWPRRRPDDLAAVGVFGLLGLTSFPLFHPAMAVLFAVALSRLDDAEDSGPSWTGLLGLPLVYVAVALGTSEARIAWSVASGNPVPSRAAGFETADVLFYQGTMELSAGDPERAVERLTRSYSRRPRPETAENLRRAHLLLGDEEQAARWARRRAELAPPG